MHRRTSAKIYHQSRSEGPFLQARLSKVHQALLRSEPPVPAFRCLRQQKASKLLTRDPLAGLLDKATLDTSLKDCHTKPLFCGQAAASNKDNQPPGKASEQKDHLPVSYSTSQVSSEHKAEDFHSRSLERSLSSHSAEMSGLHLWCQLAMALC